MVGCTINPVFQLTGLIPEYQITIFFSFILYPFLIHQRRSNNTSDFFSFNSERPSMKSGRENGEAWTVEKNFD